MSKTPAISVNLTFATMDALRAWVDSQTTEALAPNAPAAAPVAAASPTAAPAAAPTPPTPTGEVRTDAQGMPHDPAVHTESGTTNQDGTWKARKGKADEAKAARAEFLSRGGAAAAPAAPAAPAAGGMPTSAPAPAAPAAGGMPGMTEAPAAVREVSLDELIARTTELMNTGAVDTATLKTIYGNLGVTDPSMFADNPALRLSMMETLDTL